MSQPNQEPCPLCLQYICEHRQSNKDWQKRFREQFVWERAKDYLVIATDDARNPKRYTISDVEAFIQSELDNQAAEVREALEDNRNETLFDTEDSNEIAALAIDNFIKAVLAQLSNNGETE